MRVEMLDCIRSSGITYSTSNAYLDGLSLWRRAAGLAATSLQQLGAARSLRAWPCRTVVLKSEVGSSCRCRHGGQGRSPWCIRALACRWHWRKARLQPMSQACATCFSEDSALKLISPKHVRNAFHRVLAKPRLALPPALLFASRFACTWALALPLSQGPDAPKRGKCKRLEVPRKGLRHRTLSSKAQELEPWSLPAMSSRDRRIDLDRAGSTL